MSALRKALASAVLLGVVACFGLAQHQITLIASPPDGGTVAGGGMFAAGTVITVRAVPNAGFRFVNWTEEGVVVSTSDSYQFTVEGSRTLTAWFAPVQYSLGISGQWKGWFDLLPTPDLDNAQLRLTYGFGYGSSKWLATVELRFTDAQLTEVQLHGDGKLNGISLTAGLYFDATVPAYRSAAVSATIRSGDLTFIGRVMHAAKWGSITNYMLYTGLFMARPFTLTIRFEDECTGVKFKDLSVTVYRVPLCCGITYDAELSFTKAGFEHLRLRGRDVISLCCGVTADVEVKYGVGSKEVTLTPRFADLGELCLKVYGDAVWANSTWGGIEVHGFRLQCTLGPRCPAGAEIWMPYLEFVTALNPKKLAWAGFKGDEFERVRLGVCGPGCCGGAYAFEGVAYFQPSGTLFGLSRVQMELWVQLLAGLKVGVRVEAYPSGGPTTFGVGWDWKF